MRSREIGHALVAPGQMRQDSPASWISQRGESLVQRSRRIFNHLVNYLAELMRRANIFGYNLQKPHVRRRCHWANASLFTTYGIFVGSPP